MREVSVVPSERQNPPPAPLGSPYEKKSQQNVMGNTTSISIYRSRKVAVGLLRAQHREREKCMHVAMHGD